MNQSILNWTSAADARRNEPEGSPQYRRELMRSLQLDHQCRHWGWMDRDPWFDKQGFKECLQQDRFDEVSGEYKNDTMVASVDQMGCSPSVMTGPKFGCIHYKPKP